MEKFILYVKVIPNFFIIFQDLTNKNPDIFKNTVVEGLVEFEWDLYIDAKKKVRIVYTD